MDQVSNSSHLPGFSTFLFTQEVNQHPDTAGTILFSQLYRNSI